MTAYFRYPFATLGETTPIPDTVQGDGSVSLQEGYGDEYSLDLRVNPDARSIERESFNFILNKITSAIRFLQINSGYPEFIPAAENGGTAYTYAAGARVIYSGALYQAKVSTTALPTDATKWDPIDALSGLAPLTVTNAQIKENAAIDATKIYNGLVSNEEFECLNGVTSAIQTQLNGKQATGAYITSLTGDVVASGAGEAPASLSTTGVTAGFYPNANITVDAKGRISIAEAGPSPFDLYDSFEIWDSGLPQDWTSAEADQINESTLHVTQGTKSVNLNASGLVTMTKTVAATVLQSFGELVLDVFIDSIGGSDRVTLSCGANSVSTPDGATGTFTLRCPVQTGATTISISISGAGVAYVDNLRSVLKVYASGVVVDNTGLVKVTATNAQTAFSQIDGYMNSVAGNLAGNTGNKLLSPNTVWTDSAYKTLTDAASIAIDMNLGFNFTVTLGGNRTLANPTNAKVGQSGVIRVIQDGSGNRSLSFGSNYKNTSIVDLSTGGGDIDLISYFVNSSTSIIITGIFKDI